MLIGRPPSRQVHLRTHHAPTTPECTVRADDERRIEVLAQDLPCFNGAQLAIDVTFRSALCGSGEPQPAVVEVDGAVPGQT